MESLLQLDRSVFLILNHIRHSFLTNWIALILSGVGTAGIVWFVLGALLFLKEEKRDHWFFVLLFLAGGFSYVITELVLKPFFGRLRPSAEIGAILIGNTQYSPNDFSFPSGHATIAFAMAVVLTSKEPKLRWAWYSLAVLICLSRIYLGRHYPLDIIGGAVVGFAIGQVSLVFSKKWEQKFH